MPKPVPLKPGDSIGLIAPSGAFDAGDLEKALKVLREYGYTPVYSNHIFSRYREMAGPDWIRAKNLIDFWKNENIACLWCIRGGYGSIRILSRLPRHLVEKNDKVFVGYSDITFLHNFFIANGKSVVFHGPNLIDFSNAGEARRRRLISFLEARIPFRWDIKETNVIRRGVASGRLIGGNLTCLTHLLGTDYLPGNFWRKAILFIEDRGEAGYRIDRMLNHFKEVGIFEHLQGLVLGSFTACEPYDRLKERILDIVKPYQFPVICDLPFGHSADQDILPMGLEYIIDTGSGYFAPTEKVFSTQ
ncbi:S66 peptidase family protein [Thermodesulforhabdus norvegica]|uniref:Muramoyltetrapeptide carboxypeptidase n=1 Tax=Thermodesulforhabdus norvegica TaxID=39841 RepID=A0A1I4U4W4_9BACT|nr:LD-carboxypeptidase [Thermodesulforhabdus norvegica]SFM83937.1 muramoyltetrapeptide carboxypeptidase [Thermodesulforhabdus norvegica]